MAVGNESVPRPMLSLVAFVTLALWTLFQF